MYFAIAYTALLMRTDGENKASLRRGRRRRGLGTLGVLGTLGGLLGVVAQADAAPRGAAACASDEPAFLLRLRGDALERCEAEGEEVRCSSTALGGGARSPLPTPSPPPEDRPRLAPAPGAPVLTVGEDSVEICAPGGGACKTVRASGEVDPGLGLDVAVSERGDLVALAYLESRSVVEVFDVASGKQHARFFGRSRDAFCIFTEFAGAALIVAEAECGSPPSLTWLATPEGKRLADLGGKRGFGFASSPVHLRGDDWAFASARGDLVVVQDVVTGKVRRRVSLGRAKKGATATLLGDAHRLVVAYGGTREGELAVLDLPKLKVRKLAAPCRR